MNLDPAGNRTSIAYQGGGTAGYAVNALNQYTSTSSGAPTYDADGNLTSYQGWAFTYDAESRLRSASNGSVTYAWTYDGLGRKVVQSGDGPAVQHVYQGAALRATFTLDDTALVAQFESGDAPDELVVGVYGQSYAHYHQDRLGNVVAVSDSNGVIQELVCYGPYGNPFLFDADGSPLAASAFNNDRYLTGRPYVPLAGWTSGLVDLRARAYAPDLGRFLQADPTGFAGSPGNLYAYCEGDSVDATDPFGTDDEPTKLLNDGDGGLTEMDGSFPTPDGSDGPMYQDSNNQIGHVLGPQGPHDVWTPNYSNQVSNVDNYGAFVYGPSAAGASSAGAAGSPGTGGGDGWQRNIKATDFGGPQDPNKSAYTGRVLTAHEPGFALPAQFVAPHNKLPNVVIEVRNTRTGQTAVGPIVDIGPHYGFNPQSQDPYWETHTRPSAEQNYPNRSGLDVLPQSARQLGFVDHEAVVDWRFVRPGQTRYRSSQAR